MGGGEKKGKNCVTSAGSCKTTCSHTSVGLGPTNEAQILHESGVRFSLSEFSTCKTSSNYYNYYYDIIPDALRLGRFYFFSFSEHTVKCTFKKMQTDSLCQNAAQHFSKQLFFLFLLPHPRCPCTGAYFSLLLPLPCPVPAAVTTQGPET